MAIQTCMGAKIGENGKMDNHRDHWPLGGKWRRKPSEGANVVGDGKMAYPAGPIINDVELVSEAARKRQNQ